MAHKEAAKKYYHKNREYCLELKHKAIMRVKEEVLTHYGFGKCACIRCGFDDIRALSIDHIEGGGSRRDEKGQSIGGTNLYYRLRRENYPPGYITLCMNCQFIKRVQAEEFRGRYCPV